MLLLVNIAHFFKLETRESVLGFVSFPKWDLERLVP